MSDLTNNVHVLLSSDIDSNVRQVIFKHAKRAEAGLRKYGVTTERDDLTRLEWLQHLQDELMDAAVYAEVLMSEEAKRPQDWMRDVFEFHQKFGCKIGSVPCMPDENTQRLRAEMEKEELEELLDASNRGDLAEVADAIADLIYVLLGRAVSYGIDLRPVWDEVHRTNMLKEGGSTRADGKILKPAGWKPPAISELLKKQGKSITELMQ